MADAPDPIVYTALVRAKPRDLTLGAWATKAGMARNQFNLIRQHGNPKHETLQKLLAVEGVDVAAFEETMNRTPRAIRQSVTEPVAPFDLMRNDRPRDVPVLGTPSCGDYEVDGQHIETVEMDLDDVIDFVRRPPALEGRGDAYAIYPQGFSMVPKFEPGDVAFVDARKPPAIGDYVVVQLKKADDEDGDRIVSALLKRLVRQSAQWVELEQFNPATTFRVERRRIAAIHRVYNLSELVGI